MYVCVCVEGVCVCVCGGCVCGGCVCGGCVCEDVQNDNKSCTRQCTTLAVPLSLSPFSSLFAFSSISCLALSRASILLLVSSSCQARSTALRFTSLSFSASSHSFWCSVSSWCLRMEGTCVKTRSFVDSTVLCAHAQLTLSSLRLHCSSRSPPPLPPPPLPPHHTP